MSWLSKTQWFVVKAVTIGGSLGWYEIFLFAYWAQQIGELFFAPSDSDLVIRTNAFLLFALGLASRPIGGLIFGLIGDRWGRKASFTISIIGIAIPSIAIGFLPFYAGKGLISLIILGFLRFAQGIPAGGELPGAMCYLAEYSTQKNMRLLCSFTFIGPQLGGIFGLIETSLFEIILGPGNKVNWTLGISFWIGGLIALYGLHLRRKLHETPDFLKLEKKHLVIKTPIFESFRRYYGKMTLMFFLSLFEVVGYFILAVFPIAYFDKLFDISRSACFLITAALLILSAIIIPFFGRLGDKYIRKNKLMLNISMVMSVILSYPLYLAVNSHNLLFTVISQIAIMFFLNIQFALLPSFLATLVPTRVRFTCLGFGFNTCDGIVGGLTTYFGLSLISITNIPGSFILLLPIAAILSAIALFFVNEPIETYDSLKN